MASFLLTKCLCLLFKFSAFSSLFLFISDDDNIKHPYDNEEAAVDEICHQQIKFNFTPTQVKEAQRVHFSFINLFILLDSKNVSLLTCVMNILLLMTFIMSVVGDMRDVMRVRYLNECKNVTVGVAFIAFVNEHFL